MSPAADAPARPTRPVLLRLPFSHYCRKAEACLSQAGIEYDVLDVGLRRMPVPVHAAGTVPVLRVGDRLLTDSHDIALWADAHAAPGTVPLRTGDPAVLAWMVWADEVGAVARRQAYRCAYNDPAAFTRRRLLRIALRLWRPTLLRVLKAYRVRRFDDADREAGPRIIARIADGLAATGTGHLVGDAPTAADLTVANLVAPLVRVGAWAGLDREPGWGDVAGFVAAHRVPSLRHRRRRARASDLRAWAALGH